MINKQIELMRQSFADGHSFAFDWRIEQLSNLKRSLKSHESKLMEALALDLGKSAHESYMTEISQVYQEIDYFMSHLKKLMKPKRVHASLAQFPSRCLIQACPYGLVLILSPWNYPVLLSLQPLIGALAAGNLVILKPSEYSVHTTEVLIQIIADAFKTCDVFALTGDAEVGSQLLEEKFDYIFFTGSPRVGQIVMQKASVHLTPVTLELGGKSPCIVDKTADLQLASRRIVFGKLLNAGQTCVAPDYVLVDETCYDSFVSLLIQEIDKQCGHLEAMGKIINQKHFDRLISYLSEGKILYGGKSNANTRQIMPTLVGNLTGTEKMMQEEIFGPILPIIPYQNVDEALAFIEARPHPLACYAFTNDSYLIKYYQERLLFGGGCINDTIMHLSNDRLPFGGIGSSGMGKYHGKYSFETFSHLKAIVKKSKGMENQLRYRPYTENKLRLLRRLIK